MRGAILAPALVTLLSTVSALPPTLPPILPPIYPPTDAEIDQAITGTIPLPPGAVPLYHLNGPKNVPGEPVCIEPATGRDCTESGNEEREALPDLNSTDIGERDVQLHGHSGGGYGGYQKDDSLYFSVRLSVKVDPERCQAEVDSDDRKVKKVSFADCDTDGLTLSWELVKEDFGPGMKDHKDYPIDGDDKYPMDHGNEYPTDRFPNSGPNSDYGNGYGRNDYGNNDYDSYEDECKPPRCQCSPEDECKPPPRCQCSPKCQSCRPPRCQCSPGNDKCDKCKIPYLNKPNGYWKQTEGDSTGEIDYDDCADYGECGDSDRSDLLSILVQRDPGTESRGGRGYSTSSRYGDAANGGSSYDYRYGDRRNGGSGYGYDKHESSSYEYPPSDYSDDQCGRGHGGWEQPCPPHKDKWIFVLNGFRPQKSQDDYYPQGGDDSYPGEGMKGMGPGGHPEGGRFPSNQPMWPGMRPSM